MRDRLELSRAFKASMVFACNTDLFDPKWNRRNRRGIRRHRGDHGDRSAQIARLFTVVITETGARSLHRFSQDLQWVG